MSARHLPVGLWILGTIWPFAGDLALIVIEKMGGPSAPSTRAVAAGLFASGYAICLAGIVFMRSIGGLGKLILTVLTVPLMVLVFCVLVFVTALFLGIER